MGNTIECNSIERNSVECNEATNLNVTLLNNQRFRLNKINGINNCFIAEIKERKLMSKRLSKYIFCCDYVDRFLTVLSATNSSISIASFATVIGALVGIASTSIGLTFSLSTGLVKNY